MILALCVCLFSPQAYSAPGRTYASFVGYDTEAQRTVLAAQALLGSRWA